MALEKQIVIDKIEILELGHIQVREVVRIIEDGNELSSSYNRFSFYPGQDLTGQPAHVQAIAQAAWTPEVIAAYEAQQQANQLGAQ